MDPVYGKRNLSEKFEKKQPKAGEIRIIYKDKIKDKSTKDTYAP